MLWQNDISPKWVLEIDLRMVYDFVEWTYLKHVMLQLGCPM